MVSSENDNVSKEELLAGLREIETATPLRFSIVMGKARRDDVQAQIDLLLDPHNEQAQNIILRSRYSQWDSALEDNPNALVMLLALAEDDSENTAELDKFDEWLRYREGTLDRRELFTVLANKFRPIEDLQAAVADMNEVLAVMEARLVELS